MIITLVRVAFKDVHEDIYFNNDTGELSGNNVEINTNKIWSGDNAKDDNLKGADW